MSSPTVPTSRVWDLPVRLVHLLFIACFAGAWLTAESERWRTLHVTLGLTMAALALFRVVWGFLGTRHARFADFLRGPRAVGRYLGTLLRGRPDHHEGHNPAGGWAILALLGLILLTTATGWAVYSDWAGDALGEAHEVLAEGLLLLVAVHVAAVLVSGWLHGENLVRAMITGRKASDGPGVRPAAIVAAALLAGVLGFWALQWQAPVDGASLSASAGRHDHDEDDD